MIVDVRSYTAHPGLLPKYFADYAAGPFAVQTKHLGKPLGFLKGALGTARWPCCSKYRMKACRRSFTLWLITRLTPSPSRLA